MIPLENIDLAIFGHVHTHQTLHDGKILIPGSLERVDFGETKEDKGFHIYDTEQDKLTFISNNPRILLKHYIEVPRVNNPTNYLIEKIPPTIEDAIVRLIVKISPEMKNKIILPRLIEKLKPAFHSELIWDTSSTDREVVLPEFVLDPLVLFNDFISEKFPHYPELENLRTAGLKILDKALSKVEEKQ